MLRESLCKISYLLDVHRPRTSPLEVFSQCDVLRAQLIHQRPQCVYRSSGRKYDSFFGSEVIANFMREMPLDLPPPYRQVSLRHVRSLNPHTQC